jgi:hypothetical protein
MAGAFKSVTLNNLVLHFKSSFQIVGLKKTGFQCHQNHFIEDIALGNQKAKITVQLRKTGITPN